LGLICSDCGWFFPCHVTFTQLHHVPEFSVARLYSVIFGPIGSPWYDDVARLKFDLKLHKECVNPAIVFQRQISLLCLLQRLRWNLFLSDLRIPVDADDIMLAGSTSRRDWHKSRGKFVHVCFGAWFPHVSCLKYLHICCIILPPRIIL
jgi:hypothetical protein